MVNMGWKEFAASVINSVLSWPVIALIVVLLLLEPLRKLIGRVKGAKGFGGEVEFNDLIEDAEENVDIVLDESPPEEEARVERDGREPDSEPSNNGDGQPDQDDDTAGAPHVNPANDPSGAILVSWESLVSTLGKLSRSATGRGRPARNPRSILDQLRRNELVSTSFYNAVVSLYEVRNQVAHGEAIPTTGTAFTYVERAKQLERIAAGMTAVEKMDLDKHVL